MRILYPLLFISLISLPVYAGESINKSIDASPTGKVIIENVRGDIKVLGWKKTTVQVSGELDDETELFTFERSGDDIHITVKLNSNRHKSGDGSKLIIQIPENNRLIGRVISADISANDVSGGITLNSVSGDIKATKIAKGAELKSVSGDIRINEVSGNSQIETVSGDLHGNFNSPTLSLKSTSGDARITNGNTKLLTVTTVSGDIVISSNPVKDSDIKINTVSGDVNFTFTGKPNTYIDIQTTSGDKNTNLASGSIDQIIIKGKRQLKLKTGNGEGQMKIKTVSGDIHLND